MQLKVDKEKWLYRTPLQVGVHATGVKKNKQILAAYKCFVLFGFIVCPLNFPINGMSVKQVCVWGNHSSFRNFT